MSAATNTGPSGEPMCLTEATTWVCRFSAWESMSVSVIQGAPIQLFLLGHGAGPAVVGVVVALFPLSMALQFPMALQIPRRGLPWTLAFGRRIRIGILACLAAIALGAGELGGGMTVALVVVATGLFHALFSAAITARSPWWAALAPHGVRGRFLAQELLVANISLVAFGLVVSVILSLESQLKFPLIFLLAALAGLAALRCISYIPVVPVPPMPPVGHGLRDLRKTTLPRLLAFQLAFGFANGGHAVCWIIVLRDRLHWSDQMINFMPMAAAMGIIPLLPLLGRLLDGLGSRSCLILATFLSVIHLGLWAATAGGAMPVTGILGMGLTIALLQGTATTSVNLMNLASGRLVMGQTPLELQALAAATMTLVGSLLGATFPLAWGLIAERVSPWQGTYLSWAWNGHALMYAAMAGIAATSLFLVARLQEPGAPSFRKALRALRHQH
jgi:hypothetical protein